MRKIFGGAMALSALGAVIMGSSLAWKDSQVATGAANVGTMDWTLHYMPDNSQTIGPDDGVNREVGLGYVSNAAGADFNIKWNAGKLLITNAFPSPGDTTSCASSNFGGVIEGLNLGFTNPIAPGNDGAAFAVKLNVAPGAPDACMGDIVGYAIEIEMATAGS